MKKAKRLLALALALGLSVSLAACGPKEQGGQQSESPKPSASQPVESQKPVDSQEPADTGSDVAKEITLWTYPIGNWGKEAEVKALTDAFKADTGITVNVEYLAYADGDDKVNSAIAAKNAPDLVMEGPERLVANWGASGYMVDLSDMLSAQDRSEIQERAQCLHRN